MDRFPLFSAPLIGAFLWSQEMNIAELASAAADSSTAKVGGTIGGGTAIFGLTVDLSSWSANAVVLADLGIFFGGVAGLLTFIWGIWKGGK